MVLGMSFVYSPQKNYEGCLIGKQPRKAFKTKAPQRAKQPLGIVHSDVCGPFDTPSLGGNRYFLTFVDEFTKKIWIYLLKEKGAGEAVTIIAYVLNRCPTKRLQSVTPEEAWTEDKPTVNHLRIFGSLSYRHIPDERRRKLDDKSEALILIGYHPTGAYKLYNPLKQQVVISRDVVVDETAAWKWENESKIPDSYILEDSPRTKDVNPASSIQPPRTRFPSTRLADYELYNNSSISDDDEMVHFAFMVDTEPLKSDGSIAKHKARLVAKGFLQKQGIDYTEVYAPVARMETIRLVIVVASSRNWTICQLDVKSAFLNGPLEEVYILQPLGFEIKGKECKEIQYKNLLFVCLYVDDLIITGDVNEEIEQFKEKMKSKFDMTNLGILHYFLGSEFMHTKKGIFLH
ncbi:hypothetical protein CR513_18237, partial [Mucuna pruriens]